MSIKESNPDDDRAPQPSDRPRLRDDRAFCGTGCRRAFVEGPGEYLRGEDRRAEDLIAHGAPHDHAELPVIDEGMRRWYESCSCCLSEAFPDIKAQLDAERAAAALAPVEAGICEVAEAAPGR
ncbi:MAG: hypothetical protein HY263_03485 [Chloroflexi bacterium]|nr:hypothetical protein [Chloroflexota bacterium]